MKKCLKDNVEQFRAEIKATVPEFYTLVKDLYANGMIDGLRSVELEIGAISSTSDHQEIEIQQNKAVCADCGLWVRDKIGDGTGIGLCLLKERPTTVKWPGTDACNRFEALA